MLLSLSVFVSLSATFADWLIWRVRKVACTTGSSVRTSSADSGEPTSTDGALSFRLAASASSRLSSLSKRWPKVGDAIGAARRFRVSELPERRDPTNYRLLRLPLRVKKKPRYSNQLHSARTLATKHDP